MIVSFSTRIPVIPLAVTGTMAAKICEFLNLLVERALGAPIRQPNTEATDLSFKALDEELTNYSTSSN